MSVDAVSGTRATFLDGEVRVTSAHLNAFWVNELVFPASYRMQLDPEEGYVAVVLEGTFEKTFVRGARPFSPGSAFTMPPGAFHTTRFDCRPTRVVVLHPVDDGSPSVPWGSLLRDFREARAPALGTAWRLAGELRARDDAWALAAEGFCLELVASIMREESSARARKSAPPWLVSVRERLHARIADRLSLTELADAAGVHPVYLARTFREQYGVSIGEYVRRMRLDWSAAELTATETPIAVVAAEAGFADQSHFTRAFKRHIGLTPGRYRAVRRSGGDR
jgi:AraC family transcriptional regulator